MIVHNMEQGTEEWFQIKLGKWSASTIDNLFASPTTASYRNLVRKIAYERLTGKRPEDFKSDFMNRGNEMEPLAVEAYEREKMESIELVGFCENEDHKSGCSPDGLVGEKGMVQFKSPKYSTMFDYFVKNESITDRQFLGRLYFNQVQMEMLITDREWSDYVVFEPELPLVIRRVKADIDIQNDILRKILVAESEVDILMELVENYSK